MNRSSDMTLLWQLSVMQAAIGEASAQKTQPPTMKHYKPGPDFFRRMKIPRERSSGLLLRLTGRQQPSFCQRTTEPQATTESSFFLPHLAAILNKFLNEIAESDRAKSIGSRNLRASPMTSCVNFPHMPCSQWDFTSPFGGLSSGFGRRLRTWRGLRSFLEDLHAKKQTTSYHRSLFTNGGP